MISLSRVSGSMIIVRATPENSFHFSSSAVSRTRIEGSPLKISVTPFLSIRKRSC